MFPTAEIRWFWPSPEPALLRDWFCRAGKDYPAAGGEHTPARTDEYLVGDEQFGLGIKQRGGGRGVEIKVCVNASQCLTSSEPFTGAVEIWTKATSHALTLDPAMVIRIHKRRWLRKFGAVNGAAHELALNPNGSLAHGGHGPANGCNVEWTQVTLVDTQERWWTLGFEAFGDYDRLGKNLVAAVAALAQRHPPFPPEALLASYPGWLKSIGALQKRVAKC